MGICSAQQTKQPKLMSSPQRSVLASPASVGRKTQIIKNKKHSVFQIATKSVPLIHGNVFQFYTIYPKNNHINKLYRAFQVQHILTGQIRFSIVIDKKNADGMNFYKKMKKQLDHPNICQIYEIYKDKKEYHIITEYCQGESLEKFCVNELSEPEVRRVMEQIIKAVNYLHQYNHKCRLSLKSFHFLNESDRLILKFTDFLSIYGNMPITHDQILYQSPEECKSHPTSSLQSDIWSLGVIFYQLLNGKPPFSKHSTVKHTQTYIKKGEIKFDTLGLQKRNSRALDLLKQFLQMIPEDRINISKAIQETYFIRDSIVKSQDIVQYAIDNITIQKRRINKLQHYIYQFMIKQFASEMQQKLSDLFYAFDANKDGRLNKEEVRTMIQSVIKSDEVEEQVNKIFEIADLDLSGDIDLNEFILATIDKGFIVNKNNIELAFKMLDVKKTGKLYSKDFSEQFELDATVVSNYISEFLQKLSVKKNINQSHSDYFTLEEFRIFMFQIL